VCFVARLFGRTKDAHRSAFSRGVARVPSRPGVCAPDPVWGRLAVVGLTQFCSSDEFLAEYGAFRKGASMSGNNKSGTALSGSRSPEMPRDLNPERAQLLPPAAKPRNGLCRFRRQSWVRSLQRWHCPSATAQSAPDVYPSSAAQGCVARAPSLANSSWNPAMDAFLMRELCGRKAERTNQLEFVES